MGRAPCCDKANVKRGPWSPEEDEMLKSYIEQHGTGGNWISLPSKAGLRRCGKSCRLRWLNYLRPDIKHGKFTEEEDRVIFSLYNEIGSRWSIIAAKLHGRTDNDVKNHWNTKLKKLVMMEDENNAFSKILSNPPAAAAAHSSSVTSDHESYSFVKFPNLKNETHQESLPNMPNLLPSFSGYGSSSSFVHNGFMVPTGLSKPPFSADSNLSSTISIAGNLSWADGAGNCVEDSGFLMDILNYGVEGMNHGCHLFQASVESGDQKFSGTEELGTATSSAMLSDYMMYEFKAQGLIDQY